MRAQYRFVTALTVTTTIHAAIAGALIQTELPEPAGREAVKIAVVDISTPEPEAPKPVAPTPKPPAPPIKKPLPPKVVPKPKPVAKPVVKPLPKPKPTPAPVTPSKSALTAVPLPKPPETPQAAPAETSEAPVSEPAPPSASAQRRQAAESYLGRVRQKVQACLCYPMTARRLRLEGESRLRFIILSDGSINALALQRSSGHRTLDEQALATIRNAAPFEAPPEGKALSIVLPVTFNLRHGG
ncbi:energy transducer TonB [Sulfurimonas sp. HSL-3221]|uniref:energy transducer TonB n=1 Tax=Sulfurimonadaceae TaxID=2771471 RepID=UPI001E3C842D|nr:energy transducer TonB [Sulfurimonas sp. HSL-3221]UFS62588.1 energy transducer TonB [Sulfurimonas sp. HSL-3221]